MDDPARIHDVDRLWAMLQQARDSCDAPAVAAIKDRMRELQESKRFADVSDEDLDARIAALRGSARTQPISYAGMVEDSVMNNHVRDLNDAMAEGAEHEALGHLDAMLAERRRRHDRDAHWAGRE